MASFYNTNAIMSFRRSNLDKSSYLFSLFLEIFRVEIGAGICVNKIWGTRVHVDPKSAKVPPCTVCIPFCDKCTTLKTCSFVNIGQCIPMDKVDYTHLYNMIKLSNGRVANGKQESTRFSLIDMTGSAVLNNLH